MTQTVLDMFVTLIQKQKELTAEIKDEKNRILAEYEDGEYLIGETEEGQRFMIIETVRRIRYKTKKIKKMEVD